MQSLRRTSDLCATKKCCVLPRGPSNDRENGDFGWCSPNCSPKATCKFAQLSTVAVNSCGTSNTRPSRIKLGVWVHQLIELFPLISHVLSIFRCRDPRIAEPSAVILRGSPLNGPPQTAPQLGSLDESPVEHRTTRPRVW